MHYENLFSDHPKHSCLSPNCQRALLAVSHALHNKSLFPKKAALPKALDELANEFVALPPEIIPQAAREINIAARLWPLRPRYTNTSDRKYFSAVNKEVHKMESHPELALLYLFHSDGRLREAALHRVQPDMLSPFVFAAITIRLNDWARPVRQESARCLGRVRASKDYATIAPALPFLSLQSQSWKRWGSSQNAFARIEATPEVADYMAVHLSKGAQGPLARQLLAQLRHPAIDRHLSTLAQNARSLAVRAVAVNAVLRRKAQWKVGVKKRWIDKSRGVFQMDPVLESRKLSVSPDRAALAGIAAHDRSVIVRRVVANWLLTVPESYPDIVAMLSKDKYPSVRNAMDFYQRKQAENA